MPAQAIYVSSKRRHRDNWLVAEMPTISSWLHGEELPPEKCSKMWDRYRQEIESCDVFVLYAETNDHLKGSILELGLAFAHSRRVIIVWTGSIEELADKIGTIAYHKSVTVVESIKAAIDLLQKPCATNWKRIPDKPHADRSAPFDGEPCLIWKPNERMVGEYMMLAYWDHDHFSGEPGWVPVGAQHKQGYFSEVTNSLQGFPTHWTKAPERPASPKATIMTSKQQTI